MSHDSRWMCSVSQSKDTATPATEPNNTTKEKNESIHVIGRQRYIQQIPYSHKTNGMLFVHIQLICWLNRHQIIMIIVY